jgi:small-conductance mechanosensitive channel
MPFWHPFIRAHDGARVVVPNEKLASDTIRTATIRSRETFAEVTVQVPLTADLGAAVDGLREEVAGERHASVLVSGLDASATLMICAAAAVEDAGLRAPGVWG